MADDINNSLLISLVKQNAILWDKTLELYKNRVATREAWNDIMKVLNPDMESRSPERKEAYIKILIQRWTNLRDNYNRYLKKIREQKRSGARPTKPYIYSKKMSFLQKIMQPDQTASDLVPESVATNSEIEENNPQSEESEIEIPNEAEPKYITTKSIPKKRTITYVNDHDTNPIETKMLKFEDPFNYHDSYESNRHLMFFKGILPSLDYLDEDEILEFQMGVLQLLKKIKSCRQNQNIHYAQKLSTHRGQFSQEHVNSTTIKPSRRDDVMITIKSSPKICESDDSAGL